MALDVSMTMKNTYFCHLPAVSMQSSNEVSGKTITAVGRLVVTEFWVAIFVSGAFPYRELPHTLAKNGTYYVVLRFKSNAVTEN